MVGSCGVCQSCREGLEQYCEKIPVLTYNAEDKILGGVTYGGYSESIVVDEAFVLKASDKLDLAARLPFSARHHDVFAAASLECAQGQKVGIVGLASGPHGREVR